MACVYIIIYCALLIVCTAPPAHGLLMVLPFVGNARRWHSLLRHGPKLLSVVGFISTSASQNPTKRWYSRLLILTPSTAPTHRGGTRNLFLSLLGGANHVNL